MSEVPAGYRQLIDRAIDTTRKQLETGKAVPGLAFIDARADDKLGMVIIPMAAAPSKDAWAKMVRFVSEIAEARFVLLVSEIWMIEGRTKAEMDERREQYKEVRLMPGNREGLLVQLETHDGMWQGLADVTPLAVAAKPGCKTFGTVEFDKPRHYEGRFASLLGSKRPRQ